MPVPDANQPADARPPGQPAPSGGARQRNHAQPPAVLNQAPGLVALLRCLRRRLAVALTLGLILAGLAGAGTWFYAPPPKHQVRTLVKVPAPARPAISATR